MPTINFLCFFKTEIKKKTKKKERKKKAAIYIFLYHCVFLWKVQQTFSFIVLSAFSMQVFHRPGRRAFTERNKSR